MRFRFSLAALFAATLPVTVLALEYSSNHSLVYKDAPFHQAEAAGIGLLTEIGAVEGYPDGTFGANRLLNRAEFLKIVLQSHPTTLVAGTHAGTCFPDVAQGDWFSRYVCFAAQNSIVGGYPDGYFRPGNSVLYAEALKILSELYDYPVQEAAGEDWYLPYAQEAKARGTALPLSLEYAEPLTRGHMARLAAAFRAEYEGELEAYRRAEQGLPPLASSSSVSSSSQQSSESSESSQSSISSQSSQSSSSASSQQLVTSHFLLTGQRTPAIASGYFEPRGGPAEIRHVEVVLDQEVVSFDALYLVTASGVEIGELILDSNDQDNETWTATFEDPYTLSSEGETLYLQADLFAINSHGRSGELANVRRFSVTVREESGLNYELGSGVAVQPSHQTALSRLIAVESLLDTTGTLQEGGDKVIAQFRFVGTGSTTNTAIEHLSFTVVKSYAVGITAWEIGSPNSVSRHSCATEGPYRVNCYGIPRAIGAMEDGEGTLTLYGDIELAEVQPGQTLQVNLQESGKIGQFGSIRWTDGSSDFGWVELSEPIAEGTEWRIEDTE